MTFLVALQIVVMFVPVEAGPVLPETALSALAVYLLAALLALPLDGRRAAAASP
jgi:hypothetical protein